MRMRWKFAATSVAALVAAGALGQVAFAQSEGGAKVARVEIDPATPTTASELAPGPGTSVLTDPVPPAAIDTAPSNSATTAPPATIATASDSIVADVRQRLARTSQGTPRDERLAAQQLYAVDGAQPLWLSDTGLSARGAALLAELQRADDWGLQARDFDVGALLAADATIDQRGEQELRLTFAALKYARHARGGRVDPTQLSSYLDRKAQLLPAKRVLDELAAAPAPDTYLRGLHPQHPQFEALRKAYLAMRDAAPVSTPETPASEPAVKPGKAAKPLAIGPERGSLRKLAANMEMWRWMPTDLGATHLLVNVPEFQFRLTRNGQVVHTERVITGKPETQTPIFSDVMETVVFKPTWNVPDSIKVKELLPALARNPQALARQGLRVAYNGKEIDPTTIDWSTTDIRALHVFQPPSGDNALGIVKFLFPNKHAVYLHDTPTKALFAQTRRTFSHGCIRVRNPVRLAEVLMEGDRNWPATQVAAQLAPGAPDNNNTSLTKKFPVHIAYFTAWANEAGEMQYFPDVYGYETNIHLGLDGKTHLIARKKEESLGAIRAATIGTVVQSKSSTPANRDWMKSVFGNNSNNN
jgi:L,D-transpeptidase YcbB